MDATVFAVLAALGALGSLAVSGLSAALPEFSDWWNSHNDRWKQSRFIWVGAGVAVAIAAYKFSQGELTLSLDGALALVLSLGTLPAAARLTYGATKHQFALQPSKYTVQKTSLHEFDLAEKFYGSETGSESKQG